MFTSIVSINVPCRSTIQLPHSLHTYWLHHTQEKICVAKEGLHAAILKKVKHFMKNMCPMSSADMSSNTCYHSFCAKVRRHVTTLRVFSCMFVCVLTFVFVNELLSYLCSLFSVMYAYFMWCKCGSVSRHILPLRMNYEVFCFYFVHHLEPFQFSVGDFCK